MNISLKSYTQKFSIGLFTVLMTGIVSWSIPAYLERIKIDITTVELKIDGNRYLYLFEIENTGRIPVEAFGLETRSGYVSASIFDDSTTTRINFKNSPYTIGGGVENVNITERVESIMHRLDLEKRQDTLSKKLLKQNYIATRSNKKNKGSWYKLNIGSQYLAQNEIIKASVISEDRLSESDIRCEFIPGSCNIKNIKVMPATQFKEIFRTLSVEKKPIKNKIYATGVGVSDNPVQGAAIVEARKKALIDVYKDVVQTLYGLRILAREESTGVSSKVRNSIEYSTYITLKTKGVLDKASLYIYSEESTRLATGAIAYEIRAYYQLPWEIDVSTNFLKSENIKIPEDEPLELSGKRPKWFDDLALINNDTAIYAVGKSTENLPYSFSKRIAKHRAIGNLIKLLKGEVKTLVKSYAQVTGVESDEIIESQDSKSYKVDLLKDLIIFAYYTDEENKVYALVGVDIVDTNKGASVEEALARLKRGYEEKKKMWQDFLEAKELEEMVAEERKSPSNELDEEIEKIAAQELP